MTEYYEAPRGSDYWLIHDERLYFLDMRSLKWSPSMFSAGVIRNFAANGVVEKTDAPPFGLTLAAAS